VRATDADITAELKRDLGADLRMVATYDAESIDHLYIRDDVEERRTTEEFGRLHNQLIRENLARSHLESDFDSGRLRSSMLGFERFLAFHFISDDKRGYVVTIDPDTEFDLVAFIRKFETVAPVKPNLGEIEFEVLPGKRRCSNCGSRRTISTPGAGPKASFHCMDCDQSFT
jgi:hypothetical protein